MALGGEQQVGEFAEHVRPDRFSLIGTGHDGGVGIDAEVIRPEPHQALDQADVRRDRGIVVHFGLAEEVLAHWRFGFGGGRRLGFCGLLHPGSFARGILPRRSFGDDFHGLLLCRLLTSRLEPLSGYARGVELEGNTIGDPAAQQAGIRDLAGVRLIELRDQRAFWIGCDCRDRARSRSEAEPMQGECRTLRVKGHEGLSPEITTVSWASAQPSRHCAACEAYTPTRVVGSTLE